MAVEGKTDAELMASMTSKERGVGTRWAISRYGPAHSLAAISGNGAQFKDLDCGVDMDDAQ